MKRLKVVLDIRAVGSERVYDNVTNYYVQKESGVLVVNQQGVPDVYIRQWAYAEPLVVAPTRPDPTRDTTGAAMRELDDTGFGDG